MLRQMRALLWKEWRQTRAVFAAVAVGMLVFAGAVWALEAWTSQPHDRGMAKLAAGLALLFGACVLGAVAFAGERRARTLAFLLDAPVPRWKIGLAKWALGVALCTALALLAVGLWLVLPGHATTTRTSDLPLAVEALRAAFVGFGACFLASAAFERPMLALILGAALGAGLVGGLHVFYPFTRPGGLFSPFWDYPLHVAACLLASGLALGVFGRVRAAASAWRKAGALGRALAALAAALVIPHTACFVLGRATLGPGDIEQIWGLWPSPDGRSIAFATTVRLYPYTYGFWRTAVLDRETGKARFLTRFNESYGLWPHCWSPDGRYFSYKVDESWWTQFSGLESLGEGWHPPYAIWLLDTRTGERQRVPLETRGKVDAACTGWAGEEAIFSLWPEEKFMAYDPAARKLRAIALPPGAALSDVRGPGMALPLVAGLVPVRSGPPRVQGSLTVYEPAARTWVERKLPAELGQDVQFLDLSGDRRRVLVCRPRPTGQGGEVVVADLANPAAKLISVDESDAFPLRGMDFRCQARFSPGGRWVHAADLSEGAKQRRVFLFDTRTGWKAWRPAPERGEHWWYRFSDDEAELLWYAPGTFPCRVYVEEIATGVNRRLPIPEGASGCYFGDEEILFTLGGRRIARIGLDGTGLEVIFPKRRPLAP